MPYNAPPVKIRPTKTITNIDTLANVSSRFDNEYVVVGLSVAKYSISLSGSSGSASGSIRRALNIFG